MSKAAVASNRGPERRTYQRQSSAVFCKTKEAFGGLSNMAAGYPLMVNGVRIRTSEALYQSCRFPHMPDIQRLIIAQASPMVAKMKGKPYREDSRKDWDRVRVRIMRWSLRVKLACNWQTFGKLLISTKDLPIVEESRRDDFWGAKKTADDTLVGVNALGRLLMELRAELCEGNLEKLRQVEPIDIPNFCLFGVPICSVEVKPADIAHISIQRDCSAKAAERAEWTTLDSIVVPDSSYPSASDRKRLSAHVDAEDAAQPDQSADSSSLPESNAAADAASSPESNAAADAASSPESNAAVDSNTSSAVVPIEANSIGSQTVIQRSLYELFLRLLEDLAKEPVMAEQICQRLQLHKSQLFVWISQALKEGHVKKLTKPIRYQWGSALTTQPSLPIDISSSRDH